MSQEFESDFDDIGRTRSGKKYKVDFKSPIFEDSPDHTRQQSPSTTEGSEGGIPYNPYTPQKQTGTQNNPVGTPSSSSLKVPTTDVARIFTLACADEHLLRNLESLVAVQ